MVRFILFSITHGVALGIGFALGVYFLPILTAPESPELEMLEQTASGAVYTAEFTRDLEDSDLLHWGEGTISLTEQQIVHVGRLSPGPDYKLYLISSFIETEAAFLDIKDQALRIGDIKNFDGFLIDIPEGVDISQYNTVLIWCEAFSEFITAAQYK